MATVRPRQNVVNINPNKKVNLPPVGSPGIYAAPSGNEYGYTPLTGPDAPLNYAQEPAPVDNGPSAPGGSAAYDPTTDPVYAAYIANLDLSLAQQQGDTERRRAALLGQQDKSLYDTAQAGEMSREGISGGYESRGLFNSGGRLRDISRQQANQGTQESRIRQSTSTGIGDLEYALAQAQAQTQLKKQNASQGIFQ